MTVELEYEELQMIINALNAQIDVVPDDPTGTEYELVCKLQEYVDDADDASQIDNYYNESEVDESLNEDIQLLDKVKYKKDTGYVIGQYDKKLIVQVQGNTYMVDPKDLKEFNKKPDPIVTPHMKFDEKTQALLFEQYVKCGIYLGNIPIKVNDCYVRYNQWEKAADDQQIKVLLEGNAVFMPKSQIRIFENINEFANEENYVSGVIIDEATEEALESVLINAIDYTNAIGDADGVKIIKQLPDGTQELQTAPKSSLRTLAV